MDDIVIRECVTISELDSCVCLQREVFGLPELEISPRRHLVVSRQAGGWTLGAFANKGDGPLVGFVHHMAAVRNGNEVFGYSHMMAVDRDYQNKGVGARLKWAQRQKALAEGRDFIKWTWDPLQARNAHFNLNRLGVTVTSYAVNFYGTDYGASSTPPDSFPAIDSDRLFAGWSLSSPRVNALGNGLEPEVLPAATREIVIPGDWSGLIKSDPQQAREEQVRVRSEFQEAFKAQLVCASFTRGSMPKYLLYERELLAGV
jgi:predicted GNAT superfamily acetyltransferase